ncbi:pirin family protein [Lampropedia puyangensis]|uniref:Pirin family protein n=1 Tax=Lampropedia puyangensis TaxID=1330072 RepID=A0A4S8FG31_9BURK|nr:pirin family protein [Lampropedia puyangensis]THU05444.1 pirin family protein [Lampropedia puyangensis]
MNTLKKAIRIPLRDSELGEGLTIKRALPTRALRTVGPWCFLDHAGPVAHNMMNVGPHPHIGLQTFTWMIEGEIMHRDSLGYEQVIRAGQINLMTSGRGISHVEEAHSTGGLHLVQLWIALPASHRHGPAAFAHYPELPRWDDGAWQFTLLAGSLGQQHSPVEVYSPLVGVDIRLTAGEANANVSMELNPTYEYGVLVLKGRTKINGEMLDPSDFLYLSAGAAVLELARDGHEDLQLMVIGGEPLAQTPIIWWNFVGYSTEEVVEATRDWQAHSERFGTVLNTPLKRLPAPSVEGLVLHAHQRKSEE